MLTPHVTSFGPLPVYDGCVLAEVPSRRGVRRRERTARGAIRSAESSKRIATFVTGEMIADGASPTLFEHARTVQQRPVHLGTSSLERGRSTS